FFIRAYHCFGRSALMLSGSGTFLYFHIGVVKALWSEGLIPNIISGSSGGSVVGAILCTHRDSELCDILDENWFIDRFSVAESDRAARSQRLDSAQVRAHINQIIPDMTFQEAFELTGRHLNVSVAPAERHQNSRLLNAITSPNVLVRDAVQASGALPGVFQPITLMALDIGGVRTPYLKNRKWVDGTVADDLPAKRLARLYGVNHYIVSQANPVLARLTRTNKNQLSTLDVLRDAGRDTIRTLLNTQMSLMARPLSHFPKINSAASLTMSVINQTYSGDINLVRPMRLRSINKIIGRLTADEIRDLVLAGEQTTWPRVPMIRTQTRISQILDAIIARTDPARKQKALSI
ncbi:MAG: patatin-like phospholipase family protein, partial [Parahaliea sp.]